MGIRDIIAIYIGFFMDEKKTWSRISIEFDRGESSWKIYIFGLIFSSLIMFLGFVFHEEPIKGMIAFVMFILLQIILLYLQSYLEQLILGKLTSANTILRFLHYGFVPFWFGFVLFFIPFLFLWIVLVILSTIYTTFIMQKGCVPLLRIPESYKNKIILAPILNGLVTISFLLITWKI